MSIDISQLNSQDLEWTIKKIGGKKIKKYFKKTPQGFSNIKPGFRVQSLTDADAIEVAIKNIQKDYIQSKLIVVLDQWISNVTEKQKSLIENNQNQSKKLLSVMALKESQFTDNIGLYYKLLGKNVSSEYLMLVEDVLHVDQSFSEEEHNEEELEEKIDRQAKGLKLQKRKITQLEKTIDEKERMLEEKCKELSEYKQKNLDLEKQIEDQNQEIIKLNEDVEKSCEITYSKWQEKYIEEIETANKKIKEIQTNIKNEQQSLEKLKTEKKKIKQDYDALELACEEKLTLADNIEKEAKRKIDESTVHATKFITDVWTKYAIQNKKFSSQNPLNLFHSGNEADQIDTIVYKNYNNFLENLDNQLYDCGVSNNYTKAFAAYLYAAFVNKVPIILAGSSSIAIANAFSLSMDNRYPGIFNMEDNFDKISLNNCIQSDDQVILVNNPFNPSWVPYLPYLLRDRKKFILLNVPYVEDLQLVSREILNMALPIITTFIVEAREEEIKHGGKWDPKVSGYHTIDGGNNIFRKNIEEKLNIISIGKDMLSQVITDFRNLYTDSDEITMEWMFALLPYAYVENRLKTAFDLAPQDELTLNVVSLWRTLYGKDDDI